METRTTEIADGIYRLSTLVPDVPPDGFTFNQFLVDADEPLLFHTGPRAMFPLVSAAVSRIVPLADLRWITFGHVEADECGSMNQWLAAAPHAEVAHGAHRRDGLAQRPRATGRRAHSPTARCSTSAASACATSTPRTSRTAGRRACSSRRRRARSSAATSSRTPGDGPAVTTGGHRRAGEGGRGDVPRDLLHAGDGPDDPKLAELDPRTLALDARLVVPGDGARALRDLAGVYDGWLAAASS